MTTDGLPAKSFVGFGFGPIQSALFLFEAYMSGNFGRFVVAEIDADLVQAVRDNGGRYVVNIAHPDRIEQVAVEGIDIYNPVNAVDRARLVDAVSEADELATALPSVEFYSLGGQSSVARVLAEGLAKRSPVRPTIIYAAENNNRAAEILSRNLQELVSADVLRNVQILNTVVGKMSGVITDAQTIARLGLATLAPGTARAVLVEKFNRILISQIRLRRYRCAIDVFEQKADLLPFEEAKLYGHNAIHALIGYLARARGLRTMDQAANHEDIVATARAAFIDESGAALVRKYADFGDDLFTPRGYRAYAEDLLARMVNPNLNDLVARVTRDPVRKLGYEDRIYGTMCLALRHGIEPVHMAKGAGAAVLSMIEHRADLDRMPEHLPTDRRQLTRDVLARLLRGIWSSRADHLANRLIDLTWQAI